MRATSLFTLTAVAAIIAVPAVTLAQMSGESSTSTGTTASGSVGVGVGTRTTNRDLGISNTEERTGLENNNVSAGIDADVGTQLNTTADFGLFDIDNDGSLSQTEFTANTVVNNPGSMFTDLDLNRDGQLSQTEFDTFADSTNNASGGVRASR